MIHKTDFLEQVENYCLDKLKLEDKLKFECELEINDELREEVELQKEIISAIAEKDVLSLRSKLENIDIKYSQNKSFELIEGYTDIHEISEELTPEELINYYDSLPKVHVCQNETTPDENIHRFYKEQGKGLNGKHNDEDLNGFDMTGLEELEDAILETDVLNLRDTLSQVAKSIKPQFSTEDIDGYLSGELEGSDLEQFEAELELNDELKKELELHLELENAVQENDIFSLKEKLSKITETETSWNVTEKEIEEFIDGSLEGDILAEFYDELSENSDLMAEVNLRKQVNFAIGENDIMDLRAQLENARNEVESNEVKSIVPDTKVRSIFTESKVASLKFMRRSVAVLIIVVGTMGLLKNGMVSLNGVYDKYYEVTAWSPERTVSSETDYLHQANLLFSEGKYEGAIELYNKALKLGENDFVFHFYKAASLQEMDKFKEAIPEYSQVIKHGDNMYVEEAEWYRSLCYLKTGNKEIAKKELLAIIDRNSHYKKEAKAILRRLKYSF